MRKNIEHYSVIYSLRKAKKVIFIEVRGLQLVDTLRTIKYETLCARNRKYHRIILLFQRFEMISHVVVFNSSININNLCGFSFTY